MYNIYLLSSTIRPSEELLLPAQSFYTGLALEMAINKKNTISLNKI